TAALVDLVSRPFGAARAGRGGTLLGLAALCRPIGLALGPAALPLFAWRPDPMRRMLRGYAIVNAVFLAIVLAWVARNNLIANTPPISSVGTVNVYFHRAAAIEARATGRDVESVRDEWEREFGRLSPRWTESEKLRWLSEHGRAVILAHP